MQLWFASVSGTPFGRNLGYSFRISIHINPSCFTTRSLVHMHRGIYVQAHTLTRQDLVSVEISLMCISTHILLKPGTFLFRFCCGLGFAGSLSTSFALKLALLGLSRKRVITYMTSSKGNNAAVEL